MQNTSCVGYGFETLSVPKLRLCLENTDSALTFTTGMAINPSTNSWKLLVPRTKRVPLSVPIDQFLPTLGVSQLSGAINVLPNTIGQFCYVRTREVRVCLEKGVNLVDGHSVVFVLQIGGVNRNSMS